MLGPSGVRVKIGAGTDVGTDVGGTDVDGTDVAGTEVGGTDVGGTGVGGIGEGVSVGVFKQVPVTPSDTLANTIVL